MQLENHGSCTTIRKDTGGNDYLGVQRQLSETEAVLQHVQDYQETDTAEDNQAAGREVQQHVVPVRNQVLQAAQHIEAGVIEGRDGVEDTVAQGVERRVVLHEYEKAQKGSRQLEAEGHQEDGLDQPDHALEAVYVQAPP